MAYQGLTKSHQAEGTINPFRIVRFGAADYGVLQASGPTDLSIGVSTEVDSTTGERTDVIHSGIADLRLGGTVARGQLITSDAQGRGVAAAPAAGANNRYIAVALISGVADDIIPVLLSPGSVQG